MAEVLKGLRNKLDRDYDLQFGASEPIAKKVFSFKAGETKLLPLTEQEYEWALGRMIPVNTKLEDGSTGLAGFRLVFEGVAFEDAKKKETEAIEAKVMERLKREGRLKEEAEPAGRRK